MTITRRSAIGGGLSLGAWGRAPAQARKPSPNILLIYTDQQRHDTIAAFGNPVIQTPNLDLLVQQGVAFTHATTPSPVCMAARWSLQTGQWTTSHKCYSNHHPGPRPAADIPRMLRAQGYRTGLCGKNHTYLTAGDFDVFEERPVPANRAAWQSHQQSAERLHRGNPRLGEEPLAGGAEGDLMRAKTEAAIRFLESRGGRPFFLFVSYLYPHTPYHAPEPFFSKYAASALGRPAIEAEGLAAAGKPFRHLFHQRNNDAILPFDARQTALMRRVYYGMISQVDDEIGRLIQYLDDRGLSENTLVVFSADHGDYMGDHGLYTKSPAMYDCLTRVPFIARWPGVVDQNRRDPRFVSHVDLLPTFAAVAGAPVPRQAQGSNLLPLLKDGGRGKPVREAAFSEYGAPGTPYNQERLAREGLQGKRYTNPSDDRLPWEGNPVALAGRFRMARTQKWKFVEEAGGTDELYDLEADPNELANLARSPAHRGVMRELRAVLANWKKSIGAES